jgi:DNA modification methylase
VAQQLWRVIKPGGVVVWVVADATIDGSETGTSFRQALRFMEIGFRLHDTMIWRRLSLPLTHNRYEQSFEYMFVLAKRRPATFNGIKVACVHAGSSPGGKTRQGGDALRQRHTDCTVRETRIADNVWDIDAGYMKTTKDAAAYKHPAIFPDVLARDHILSWSNEGDIVLDPFNGSGTTTKMAREMGRKFIGIEINPEYCEIAANRLRQGVLF